MGTLPGHRLSVLGPHRPNPLVVTLIALPQRREVPSTLPPTFSSHLAKPSGRSGWNAGSRRSVSPKSRVSIPATLATSSAGVGTSAWSTSTGSPGRSVDLPTLMTGVEAQRTHRVSRTTAFATTAPTAARALHGTRWVTGATAPESPPRPRYAGTMPFIDRCRECPYQGKAIAPHGNHASRIILVGEAPGATEIA
jgi:hypothetical protein